MAATQKIIQVDLGSMQAAVEERVKSGRYASADEVIRAGLIALVRDESEVNEWIMKMVEESLADPTPPIPMDEAFRKLRLKHGLHVD